MKFIPQMSPLIFALFSADALLDLMKTQKDGRGNFPLTVYLFGSGYFVCAAPKLKSRKVCREFLSDFGEFIGCGAVTAAYLQEHGKLLLPVSSP